ncbi:LysR substrate-binding domain-containing protein [Chitinimonas sp. BJB300]|uniref:LysR substrate-binding domain-containing protein n=1 Tax=Chitinimonas sp. BJB300 TaxID=1559339 RepID=UPI000C0F0D66|nr:LysR substrate-binding domain-containing protein [Chitinimonas sp. BJB300]PHV10715.1 LysR family transcriptional regulator [Chitinimonas sp. BJB300]TSJ88537.1 LysR family transcriptional regulator [Chitinimonas sp. BJB300]
MELRHLRYFVAVAEELHFTRAAVRLHIGQPPLSQQIRALEEEIGAVLFERSKRRVVLTEAGRLFFDRAKRILAEVKSAAEQARRVAQGEAGELRVGFTSSLPFTSLLPGVLHDFRADWPDVRLQLRELFTAEQFTALRVNELDIGFVRFTGREAPEGIDLHEIHRDPLRLVISTQHPLAVEPAVWVSQLREEDFVTYPKDVSTGLPSLIWQLCTQAGFSPRVVQEAGEATTQIGLVAAGVGVAILPSPLECVRMEGVHYLPLLDEAAHLSLAVATRRGDQSPQIANFRTVLAAWLGRKRTIVN